MNAVQLVNAITPRNDKRPAVAASRLGRRVRTRKTPGVQSTRHRTRGRTLHEDFGFIPWVRTRWRVVSPPFNSVGDTFSNINDPLIGSPKTRSVQTDRGKNAHRMPRSANRLRWTITSNCGGRASACSSSEVGHTTSKRLAGSPLDQRARSDHASELADFVWVLELLDRPMFASF